MRRSRILSDAEMNQIDQEAASLNDTVYVVLSQHAGTPQLTGVYATEELALQAADGHPEWVIPCDVLDQAP